MQAFKLKIPQIISSNDNDDMSPKKNNQQPEQKFTVTSYLQKLKNDIHQLPSIRMVDKTSSWQSVTFRVLESDSQIQTNRTYQHKYKRRIVKKKQKKSFTEQKNYNYYKEDLENYQRSQSSQGKIFGTLTLKQQKSNSIKADIQMSRKIKLAHSLLSQFKSINQQYLSQIKTNIRKSILPNLNSISSQPQKHNSISQFPRIPSDSNLPNDLDEPTSINRFAIQFIDVLKTKQQEIIHRKQLEELEKIKKLEIERRKQNYINNNRMSKLIKLNDKDMQSHISRCYKLCSHSKIAQRITKLDVSLQSIIRAPIVKNSLQCHPCKRIVTIS